MKTNLLMIAAIALGLSACTGRSSQPNIELIQDMMEQPAVKAQEYDSFFEDKAGGARVPPENTQPVGFEPYPYGNDPIAAKANRNPMAGDMNPETLMVGQKYYQTQCAVCHGVHLNGDGSVAAKYPLKIPALNTDKIKGWTDGEIYHVITQGQGVMGGYKSHIPQAYRWQVVNYIRYLQKNEKR
jgi:mono/diheme cytochrome c family protein